MTYYRRIAVVSLVLALFTIGAATVGPMLHARSTGAADPNPIRTEDEMPNGTGIDPNTSIAMTFTTAIDRASAERAFVIYPPVPGRFSWDGQQMTFTPTKPLAGGTLYHVIEGASVRDSQGRTNTYETVNWAFRIR
jgi:hypothetical protein